VSGSLFSLPRLARACVCVFIVPPISGGAM